MKKLILTFIFFIGSICTNAQQLLEVLKPHTTNTFNPSEKCLELVYDRNYGDGDHNFIYCAVQGPNGKKWLNHNLGAEYAKESSPYFNPEAVPTDYNDWKAFGSLFQNLRRSDGHELVKYLHRSIGSNVPNSDYWLILTKGILTTPIPYPTPHIPQPVYKADLEVWTEDQLNINNWLENIWLNPCPSGYRVMTSEDVISFFQYPEKINIINGSKFTASIVMNDDYPNLRVFTSPMYGAFPEARYDSELIESSTYYAPLEEGEATSSLWVIVEDNGPEEFYFNDGVIKTLGRSSSKITTLFDRGISNRSQPVVFHDYGFGGGHQADTLYRIGAGIRCVQSN